MADTGAVSVTRREPLAGEQRDGCRGSPVAVCGLLPCPALTVSARPRGLNRVAPILLLFAPALLLPTVLRGRPGARGALPRPAPPDPLVAALRHRDACAAATGGGRPLAGASGATAGRVLVRLRAFPTLARSLARLQRRARSRTSSSKLLHFLFEKNLRFFPLWRIISQGTRFRVVFVLLHLRRSVLLSFAWLERSRSGSCASFLSQRCGPSPPPPRCCLTLGFLPVQGPRRVRLSRRLPAPRPPAARARAVCPS